MRMIEMALHEWTRQGVERIGRKCSTTSPVSPLVTRSGSNAYDDLRSQEFYRLQTDSVTVVPWQPEKPCQFAVVLNLARQRLDRIIKTRRRIPGSGCPFRVESDTNGG